MDCFLEFAQQSPEHFDIIFFIAQRESGSLRNSGFEAAQIEAIAIRENECKHIVAEVIDGMRPGRNLTDATGFNPDAEVIWSLLAGLVIFWRQEPVERRNAVIKRAKGILLNYYGG
jgi:hypothetical protein